MTQSYRAFFKPVLLSSEKDSHTWELTKTTISNFLRGCMFVINKFQSNFLVVAKLSDLNLAQLQATNSKSELSGSHSLCILGGWLVRPTHASSYPNKEWMKNKWRSDLDLVSVYPSLQIFWQNIPSSNLSFCLYFFIRSIEKLCQLLIYQK